MLCPSMPHSASLQLIAGLDQLAAIRDFVQLEATRLGVDQVAIDDLLLAVTEVVTNSIEHGYDEQPGPITIEIGVNGGCVILIELRYMPRQATGRPLPSDPLWPIRWSTMPGSGRLIFFIAARLRTVFVPPRWQPATRRFGHATA